MAIIKCKMCGGDLNIVEGNSVCECEYCGTKQTVPNADNEKKISLFMRAGRLLRSCEFDKAAGVFETIVTDYPEEAEAYWGLVLCKYGIEYVDDPGTGKKIPTCHRSSFESVEDDTNFEQACENADAIARRLYREEARQIETLRQRILEVSGKEEPYDIFISYKELDEDGERTIDSVIAQDIYKALNKEGYRVFFSRISLEGKLGIEYEPYIFAALNSAKVMIVVGTDYEYFNAVWVKNEWSRFLKLVSDGQQKTLIPVYKDMDPYDMPKELRNLSAQNMGKIGAMQDLLHGVEKLIPRKTAASEKVTEKIVEKTVIQSEGSMKTDAAIKRGKLALEDGEWEKAKQYFDQALMLDAECAKAYFGIALAELRAKDPESYIRAATSQIPKTERLSIPEDSAHIQTVAEENTVTNFLEESEIRELYRYDLSYSSCLKGQREIESQVRQQIESNRSISRALRFAAGDEKARIEEFKKSLYAKLRANVETARLEEEENRNRTKQNYEKFLKEADGKAHDLKQEALARQTNAYQNAVSLQGKAKTVSDYQAAITAFYKTTDFQDSALRIKECEKGITALREKALRDREAFESAKKRNIATKIIIGALSAVTVIMTMTVFLPLLMKNAEYKEAVILYDQGHYDDALVIFQNLGAYKDSVDKAREIGLAKKEAAYQTAMALYEEGDYDSAFAAFTELGVYKDSKQRVEEMKQAFSAISGKYIPGTYTAKATGMGTVIVNVTVDGGVITAVEIDGSGETPEIGGAAVPTLQEQVMAAQGAEIDGVSGASLTSKAVREAVADALQQATR